MPKITRFLPLGRGLWPRPRGAHIWCRCAASVALAAELRGLLLVVGGKRLQGPAEPFSLRRMVETPLVAGPRAHLFLITSGALLVHLLARPVALLDYPLVVAAFDEVREIGLDFFTLRNVH